MSVSRILARVIVDQVHPNLLSDLLQYRGRQRSRRIAHLAALGQLLECGAFHDDGQSAAAPKQPAGTGKHGSRNPRNDELRPLLEGQSDLEFIGRLGGSLE